MSLFKGSITEVITGHSAVRSALRDTEKYSSDLQGDSDVRDYRQLPLEVDPPKHHLYRNALSPYFVKPTIEKSVPQFMLHSERLIRNYFASEKQDAIQKLVLPLVMHNLGELYRRPQDVEEWISWGPDVWTAASPVRDGRILHAYLDRVYQEALNGAKSDIWNEIAFMEIEGKQITNDEFRGIASVMLAGGRDTVVKLFTGILWFFAQHHEELEQMRAQRDRIPKAIQEFLRFFTPLPQMARTTTPETGALNLPDNRYVGISFISGNFDPSVFDNPFVIDLGREKIPHLSFGFGPHTCLGNHIAELETRVFIEALLNSGVRWTLDSCEIKYHEAPFDRVPDSFTKLVLRSSNS